MPQNDLCIDRACEYQGIIVHYVHNKDAPANEVFKAVVYNVELEKLKTARGRRCHNCARYLIPTDGDHTFCDDCWDQLMSHPFESYGSWMDCSNCGENKSAKIHQGFAEI